MPVYEQLMDEDREWAWSEGSRHFEGKSAVQEALRRIARRLGELGVPYAIAGGMALFRHGYRRFTLDVDILVTRTGLKVIHEKLVGLDYVHSFTGSRSLRDAEHGVRIEFLIAGEYPGDRKPKPLAFPDPTEAGVELDGISYLSLPKLVELKMASGMTAVDRLRDLADVIELIKTLQLSAEFAESLHPYVRERFLELWNAVQNAPPEPHLG